MSLILDGTNGLSDVDGSAATPAIRGSDANTGVFFGADIIGFSEGGTECARFNADAQFVAAAGTALLPVITTTGDVNTGIFFPAADTIAFAEGGVEAMRIDSSGNLLVGGTSSLLANSAFSVQPAGNAAPNTPFAACSGASSAIDAITWAVYSNSLVQYQFYVNYAGTVFARSASISTLSDQREKENIRPLETGLTEVMALQPRRFDWKNGSGSNVVGFIAQEVEAVLPDLIDEYRINDEETRMAVKMGDILPTLVKAIQEQQAIITALTARVEALEGAQA
jgi:hypothetical protein